MKRLTFAALLSIACTAACVGVTPSSGRAEPGPGEVAFELGGPGGAALLVPVRINGQGPYSFVLDTGATLTCVDQALAEELKLPDAAGTIAFGSTIGGSGRMRLVSIDTVTLGDAEVSGLNGCAVDLAPMREQGLDVRGLVGLNFLRNYTLTIDFEAQTVRVERPSRTEDAR